MSYKLEKYNSPFFFGTHGSNTNPRTSTSSTVYVYNATLYDGITTFNNEGVTNVLSIEGKGYAFASGMMHYHGSNHHITSTYRIENNNASQAGLKVNYCSRSYGSYGSEIACAQVSSTFSFALENQIGDTTKTINGFQRILGFY